MTGQARKRDPTTSKAAAEALENTRHNSLHKKIVRHLSKVGKDTVESTSISIEENQQSVTPRFNELMKKGIIVCLGSKRTKKNKSGRQAMLWRLAKAEEAKVLKRLANKGFVSANTALDNIIEDIGYKDLLEVLSKKAQRSLKQYKSGAEFEKIKEVGIKKYMRDGGFNV